MALVLTVQHDETVKIGDLGEIVVRIDSGGPRGGRRVQLVIDGKGLAPIDVLPAHEGGYGAQPVPRSLPGPAPDLPDEPQREHRKGRRPRRGNRY